jgi:hypothetical protein
VGEQADACLGKMLLDVVKDADTARVHVPQWYVGAWASRARDRMAARAGRDGKPPA